MTRTSASTIAFSRTVRLLGACVLLLHVLAVVALAASPRLHHWVHPDDGDDDHECVVTLFLHGGAGGPVAPSVHAIPAPTWEPGLPLLAIWAPAWVASIFAASSIIEHAPPPVGELLLLCTVAHRL